METAAGSGDFARPPERDQWFRLTEAMCDLGCLADHPGRTAFAGLLGDWLGFHVDLRGTKQREDVVALIRAAWSVPGGEQVLIDTVRVFEGEAGADPLERILSTEGLARGLGSPLPGPLTEQDVNTALALLESVAEDLPGIPLRDALAGELHLDLPMGLTPVQLFSYAVQLNVQPDGLPPAVLLVGHAAELVRAPARRHALSQWAEGWAQRAGLLAEFERHRLVLAMSEPDPAVPRCLVVAVEPARDGSGEIVVRLWLNTVPGHWQPKPAKPEKTSLDGLGPAVERALRQVVRISTAPHEQLRAGTEPTPPYVEFVLPYDLINHDMAGLTYRSGDGQPLPLGLNYAVHLRSLERMRSDDVLVRTQWLDRWNTLQRRGIGVHGWRASDAVGLREWQAALAAEPNSTAAVLDAPDGGTATEALKAAVAEGIGLAVWDRRGEFPEERREVVTVVFDNVPTPAGLPVAIHRLRRKAELSAAGLAMLGRHIAFLWDDPNRLVDIQTIADHAIDGVGSQDTIDNEETAV